MPTSLSAMLALVNDNTSGDISAADHRTTIQGLWDWIPPTEKYKMGRQAGETAHAADDFFTSITGYTEVDVTGTTTWSATRGGATVVFAGQSANDFGAFLKAVPVAGVPITIETHVMDTLGQADNPTRGLIFTDGTASTSNVAAFGKLVTAGGQNESYQFTGTLTSITATALAGAARQTTMDNGQAFTRFVWKAANTFAWSVSPDSETWTDFGRADLSTTFTPTHMGFFVSAWGATGTQIASFRYLRVYEADLSV